MKFSRRDFVPLAGVGLLGGYAAWDAYKAPRRRLTGTSTVAVVKTAAYSDDLVQCMLQGIRECGLDVDA